MDEYIDRLKMILEEATESEDAVCYVTADDTEALKAAIKALEQEPVLDKIRAEIEQKARPNEIGGRGNGKSIRYGLCMALEIIDKYRAESEEKE